CARLRFNRPSDCLGDCPERSAITQSRSRTTPWRRVLKCNNSMSNIQIPRCRCEPLINYLKALAILRLVNEQADASARACWRDGVFVLGSELDQSCLERFFFIDYEPTPIIVPWTGNDFFAIDQRPQMTIFRKTPSGSVVIS